MKRGAISRGAHGQYVWREGVLTSRRKKYMRASNRLVGSCVERRFPAIIAPTAFSEPHFELVCKLIETGARHWNVVFEYHAAILGSSAPNNSVLNIYHGTTANPAVNVSTTWTGGGAPINSFAVNTSGADQPNMAISGSRVYVAYDNFNPGGKVQVARSDNSGTTFLAANDLQDKKLDFVLNPI